MNRDRLLRHIGKTKDIAIKTRDRTEAFFRWLADGFLGLFEHYDFIIYLLIITAFSLAARYAMRNLATNDFSSYIKNWYKELYNGGIAHGLGEDIGDYTPAYMYFLALIALFRVDPESNALLYSVKGTSVFFDYLMAIYVLLLAYRISRGNRLISAVSYGLALFAPTILFNSALWGQCDSVFTAFAVMSVYYLVSGHGRTGFIMYGVSFAFKLQAVFLLPLIAYLIMLRRAKIRYILYIPLVYIVIAIPSLACGRGFADIMTVYSDQMGGYEYLSLNAPTIYMFISDSFSSADNIRLYLLPAAVYFGLAVIGTFLYMAYRQIRNPSDGQIVSLAYFFVLLAPFVLPRMHERYFYMADAFCFAYLAYRPKRFMIPLLGLLGSLSGYDRYLLSQNWLISDQVTLRLGAVLILSALILLVKDIFFDGRPTEIADKKDEGASGGIR